MSAPQAVAARCGWDNMPRRLHIWCAPLLAQRLHFQDGRRVAAKQETDQMQDVPLIDGDHSA